jgi:hypothetical protein
MDERKVYRRLRDAEEIARVLQLPEEKELTRQHVDKFIEVKIQVRKLEQRDLKLLLADNAAPVPEPVVTDAEPNLDSEKLFDDFDESDPEFLALQQRFVDLRKPKIAPMKKDAKAELKNARAKGLDLAVEHALGTAYQLHGLSAATVGLNRSEGAKAELRY